MSKGQEILVCGAGIVGVSTAIWLQRAGHKVTLIDREGPAAETSFGNAGILASAGLIPVNTPDIWRKGLRMWVSSREPLFIRLPYIPKLLHFLVPFMRHANAAGVEHYATHMSGIIGDAFEQHRALAKGTGAERFIVNADWCFGYRDEKALKKAKPDWALRERHGQQYHVHTGAEYSKIDGFYDGQFSHVIQAFNQGRISDPGQYIKALVDHFTDQGGVFEIAEIEAIEMQGDQPKIRIGGQLRGADKVVIAMGAWSKNLSQSLGLNFPIEAERGYHIEFHAPSAMPINTMMITEGKFAISPMDGRIRAAGTVEFAGLNRVKNPRAVSFIRNLARKSLGEIRYSHETEWLGYRPSLPDSLPAIGPIKRDAIFISTGHQHLGLTGGPKTGRILSQMIANQPSNLALDAYAPDRFTRSNHGATD